MIKETNLKYQKGEYKVIYSLVRGEVIINNITKYNKDGTFTDTGMLRIVTNKHMYDRICKKEGIKHV